MLNHDAKPRDSTCVLEAEPVNFISKDVILIFYLSAYLLVQLLSWQNDKCELYVIFLIKILIIYVLM